MDTAAVVCFDRAGSMISLSSFLFVASNAFALLGAYALSRVLWPKLPSRSRVTTTLASFPLLVLPALTLLGATDLLDPFVALGVFAVAAVGLSAWAVRRSHQGEPMDAEPAPSDVEEPPAIEPWAAAATFGLVLVLFVDFTVTQLLRATPLHWDDFSYHGPMAATWIQAKSLVLAPYNYQAYYPGNGELFAAWFMLPTRHDAYAFLSGFFWMTLCAAALASLCWNMKARNSEAFVAIALLFACHPFAHQARAFAAVDLAGTALAMAALAVGASVQARDSFGSLRVKVLVAGGLAGLAVGAKITYAPIGVLLLGFILWERKHSLREATQTVLLFAVTALVCGGYWYARNWLLSGNPFFPADIFVFDGPLNARVLKQTSLLHQLDKLKGAGLERAFERLLNWPLSMACVALVGYALSIVAMLRPRFWKDASARRAVLCCVAGVLATVAIASGPFSGTPNGQGLHLQVRLRFFLPIVALGIALAVYWLTRARGLRPWLTLAGGVLVAVHAKVSWPGLIAGPLLSIVVFRLTRSHHGSGRHESLYAALAPALCVVVPMLATAAMHVKQPHQERALRKEAPAWNVLDAVPHGARITWFSTFETGKYYRAFGTGLHRIPVAVKADGRPYAFMHEGRGGRKWWVRARRPKKLDGFIENLKAQNIEYVFLMKRREGSWPPQYKQLVRSKLVTPVKKRKSHALFKLEPRS